MGYYFTQDALELTQIEWFPEYPRFGAEQRPKAGCLQLSGGHDNHWKVGEPGPQLFEEPHAGTFGHLNVGGGEVERAFGHAAQRGKRVFCFYNVEAEVGKEATEEQADARIIVHHEDAWLLSVQLHLVGPKKRAKQKAEV